MVKKGRAEPAIFGDYANFLYLLTELELIVEAGTVHWSKATANATELRLEELAARMKRLATELEKEKRGESSRR